MRKIVCVSDIHYCKETQILSAFFEDLEMQLEATLIHDRYCIISGDLVYSGTNHSYKQFNEKFFNKLIKLIPSKNVFIVPGNHDVNRQYVEINYEQCILEEKKFKILNEQNNDIALQESVFIKEKFKPFDDFCTNIAKINNYNFLGYSVKLTTDFTLYMMNTALLSHAGCRGDKDSRKLMVWLEGLKKWISENQYRKKILVLHHPLTDLTEYATREIESYINSTNIDFVIYGHTHDYYARVSSALSKTMFIPLPPLYESEKVFNGYTIIQFDDLESPVSLLYREWSPVNTKFLKGVHLSGNDSGQVQLYIPIKKEEDVIERMLNQKLQESMCVYGLEPEWHDRICYEVPINVKSNKPIEFDHNDIFKLSQDIQIEAPKQFGLTCYARFLSLMAWKHNNEIYPYHNFCEFNLHNANAILLKDAEFYQVELNKINGIIIDDWNNNNRDVVDSVLRKLKGCIPDLRIILLSHFFENQLIEGVDSIESHEGFKQLYLQPLNRCKIREIVHKYNKLYEIASDDDVLERIILDMQEINEHRTPINCYQLLLAYKKQFEKRPINRYNILKLVLRSLFDSAEQLIYGGALDDDECIYILGYFVEYLIRNNKNSFTQNEFYSKSREFVEESLLNTDIDYLYNVLKRSQILIEERQGTTIVVRFRFIYWFYYFIAHRMKIDKKFSEYILSEQKMIYTPEIMEFYSGIDGQAEDAVDLLISELLEMNSKVRSSIGILQPINPYIHFKWNISNVAKDKSQEELELQVKESRLPTEYKDLLADKEYDNVKPYIQTIDKVLEEYYVRNLMMLTKSSGRVLRNSYKISPIKKQKLLDMIMDAWRIIMDSIVLLAPALAYNGYGGIGGARFNLSEEFSKDYKECLFQIILMIPFNIMKWYKDDIFSDKLMPLFLKYQQAQPQEKQMEKHIISLMVARAQPKQWRDFIQNYIACIDKNSYYLGDLADSLKHNYSSTFMSESGYRETLQLYKMCLTKHEIGVKRPTLTSIQKPDIKKISIEKYSEID